MSYAATGDKAPYILEIQQGMIGRGADVLAFCSYSIHMRRRFYRHHETGTADRYRGALDAGRRRGARGRGGALDQSRAANHRAGLWQAQKGASGYCPWALGTSAEALKRHGTPIARRLEDDDDGVVRMIAAEALGMPTETVDS